MTNDDLPPPEGHSTPSMSASIGTGAGALLWIAILFAVIAAIAYFSTAYWSGPVPPA